MTLTKNDLIEAVHSCCGIPKTKATELIESLLELVKSRLEKEEDVMISGFGKFCVKNKRERKGRNPATGAALLLTARKVVAFKYSGKLRSRLNRTLSGSRVSGSAASGVSFELSSKKE